MSVVVNRRESGDVTILDISGRVTLGEGASMLRNAIRSLARDGHTKILVNLGEATYIDSSGLGVLVSGFASVATAGGHLKLLNAISRVKDLLLITKMYTVFEVFDDEAVAVRSFSGVGAAAPAGSK